MFKHKNFMKFKTLTIKKEVYEELLKIKRKNESFSELFMRLIKKEKPDIEKFFGAWSDLSDEEFKKVMKSIARFRKEMERGFEKRLRDLK